MKIVLIGGCGHIGSFLAPRLVDLGHEVTVLSRGQRRPYTDGMPQWEKVTFVTMDRTELTRAGAFGQAVAALKPDAVCDMTSFTDADIRQLTEGLMADEYARHAHLVHIGSAWAFGYNVETPADESMPRNPITDYGRGKVAIENYLMGLHAAGKMKVTIVHPGHISGPGWVPINPQGHVNMDVYRTIKAGGELILPEYGLATLHHIHADDLAALMVACLQQPEKSTGESFLAVSPHALTLRGFAERLYAHYGHTPRIRYVPLADFLDGLTGDDRENAIGHISHSTCATMVKAQRLLGFAPRHSSMDTILAALKHLEARGEL